MANGTRARRKHDQGHVLPPGRPGPADGPPGAPGTAETPARLAERQRLCAELATDCFYDFAVEADGSLTLEWISEGFVRITGHDPTEVLAHGNWVRLIHPEDLPQIQEGLSEVLSGQPSQGEARLLVRGGDFRWVQIRAHPVWDSRQGRVVRVYGIFQDITARKQAEEARQTSEMQYRATLDAMGDPIHVVGPDLRIVLANAAMKNWVQELGLGSQLLGQDIFTLFPFLPDKVREQYRRVFAVGEVLVTEESTKIGDREFVTETRKIPLFREGRVVQVVTVLHDITAHKRALESLRESEARYRALVEISPDAITLTDLEGRVVMVNREALRLYGCEDPAELIGQNTVDLIAPQDRELAVADMQRILQSGHIRRVEYRLLRRDGTTFPAELSASLLADGQGRPIGFISVARDISERRRLEEQFRQAQKMEIVGRLAGGVAHDFNNLLTAIRGYASLARDALHQGDPVRDDIEQIIRAGERAAALTGRLLAFSRRQIMEPRLIDLNGLIVDMERMLRRLIGEPITLVLRLAAQPCPVHVDPGQIEQAFVNLVVNARDAMPGGGTLTVETAPMVLDEEYFLQNALEMAPGPYIRLSVSDTGVGMSEEVKGHLFEPFFTTKEMGQGTGLGLATVYGIVRQHQGHVTVHSEMGRGTTFDIYLPQAEGKPGPLPQPEEAGALPRGSETVLVVEDDEVVRALMVRVLRTQGYRVLEATDGNEAIRLARKFGSEVHLLLTDVVMAQMDGQMLAGLLREVYPALRVLYVSGYAASGADGRGMLESGAELLPKPFSAVLLVRRVREVLDAARQAPAAGARGAGDQQGRRSS